MSCPESARVEIHFDGDLEPRASAEIERHLSACAECAQLARDLRSLRASLRSLPAARAPAELRERIRIALDAEDATVPPRSAPTGPTVPPPVEPRVRLGAYWRGLVSGVAGSAAAALLAVALLTPGSDPLVNDLVDAHRRSLLPDRLVDVVSSDHHTVKPWFAGRADVSPPVVDFAAEGFGLVGGRVDALQGHRAAVLVYRHGAHVINVFSWPGARRLAPRDETRFGYHLVFWRAADLDYCAVSDADRRELHTLEVLLRRAGDRDVAGGTDAGGTDAGRTDAGGTAGGR